MELNILLGRWLSRCILRVTKEKIILKFRQLEKYKLKNLKAKSYLVFKETCLNNNLLPVYTHTHTHTHIYIYINSWQLITYFQFINVRRNKNFGEKTIKYINFHLLNRYFDHYNSHLQEVFINKHTEDDCCNGRNID